MKKISVKKGEILQTKGDLASKLYHVQSGLLRSYTIDNQGKEHIYMFAPEDWIISDSVPPETPSELFIDALEDSELTVLEKDFDEIEIDSEKMRRRLIVLQKRIIMLMSASALERYNHFEKTYPQIVQRVPQRMIASYLGITPEALSRVKKQRYSRRG